jgi:cell division transport system ATP-binding protein
MIRLADVSKTYGTGSTALSNISFDIDKGEFVFLMGPSGSGKTTLLRLMIKDMEATSGSIIVNNTDVTRLPKSKIPQLRKLIGVVFQDLKMLMDRTIYENIALPLEMAGASKEEATVRVNAILKQVGIEGHAEKFPIQLSGGELQRAAIARALVFSPEILLADEPTGNLDNTTSWEIVKLLQDINKMGTTVVMATHNMEVIDSLKKRTIALEKGKLMNDSKKPDAHHAHTKAHEKKAEDDSLVKDAAEKGESHENA